MNRRNLTLLTLILFAVGCSQPAPEQEQQEEKKVENESLIFISDDADGKRLMVDGKPFFVNGMNWDYIPIGTNYSFDLWGKSDQYIKKALEGDMTLLKNMGVNTIRVYTGIPPKWITYIFETYGIYTMLNHSFGRYGLTIDGNWVPNTEYSDQGAKSLLLEEVTALTKEFKDTPGLLMYLLGNENNYGLFWEGAETEDIPEADRKSTKRARSMYKLFNEAALAMKKIDPSHPVAMCNGDLQFINLIKEECKDVDIFGTNVYRGISFGDAFQRVATELDKPIMFAEFGADAFNVINNAEDQKTQADYNLANWQEIYENAAGLGLAQNSIGGFTFQFSDGWWKFGQTNNLDVHDNNASWRNGGYKVDFKEGTNNMNEEWCGICAKGESNEEGHYKLQPRAAYYAISEAHKVSPYQSDMNLEKVKEYFSGIDINEAFKTANAND